MRRRPQDYLWLAYRYASTHSHDKSTHNGAVLVNDETGEVVMFGANHFPRGVVQSDDRHERPKKYAYMEHAERDVILECARQGIKTEGLTLYVPWYACADCARAIIGAGISKVVGHKQMFDKTPERWRVSIADGDAMLDEAGVERIQLDIPNICTPETAVQVLFDGSFWTP
jgi:deoxycytidylate deaminase